MRALLPAVFVPNEAPLLRGVLLDRRDRFIATVRLDGDASGSVEAHCVNPGRMEAFVEPGAIVYVSEAKAESRKLKYTWEAIERVSDVDGEPILCGANTVRPNALVRAVLEARCLPGLDTWQTMKPEAPFTVGSHSGRADFLLDADDVCKHYVEVKNCHLVYADGYGYFPDSVSERAERHVDALAALVRQGHRSTVIFMVQRADLVHGVRPSAFHDPKLAAAVARAASAGVSFRALRAEVGTDGTRITHEARVDSHGALTRSVVSSVGDWWEANRATTCLLYTSPSPRDS